MSLSILSVSLASGVLIAMLLRRTRRQRRLRRELARQRQALALMRPTIRPVTTTGATRSAFQRDRITRLPNLLAPDDFERLQAECRANRQRAERSYIPGHKKGGTLCYADMHRHAPACLALYHAPPLHRLLSEIVGEPLVPTADHDQSSCSLLYYDQAGDHINWHYDLNFYRGRHFTVLLSLLNRTAASAGTSSGRLEQKRRDGELQVWDTAENVLVMFEGAQVLHRATPIAAGDERVMLSMTLCTNPSINPLKDLARRAKDMAYFGPRALID
jgi:hypothetical protein